MTKRGIVYQPAVRLIKHIIASDYIKAKPFLV
jgi:hypothetical protein